MPLLLSVLKNADGPDYRKLRVKAMECAGLIGSFVAKYSFVVMLAIPDLILQLLLWDVMCSGRIRQRW